jgi:hypothetical protein
MKAAKNMSSCDGTKALDRSMEWRVNINSRQLIEID